MTKREIANEIESIHWNIRIYSREHAYARLADLKDRLIREDEDEAEMAKEARQPQANSRLPVGFPFVPMTADDRIVLD